MNQRYAVEFYKNKNDANYDGRGLDFACGIVNIEDVATKFKNDPARYAMVFDLEQGTFRSPVAIFEKLTKKKTWTRTE